MTLGSLSNEQACRCMLTVLWKEALGAGIFLKSFADREIVT